MVESDAPVVDADTTPRLTEIRLNSLRRLAGTLGTVSSRSLRDLLVEYDAVRVERDAAVAELASVAARTREAVAAEIESQKADGRAVGDATWNDGLLRAASIARHGVPGTNGEEQQHMKGNRD